MKAATKRTEEIACERRSWQTVCVGDVCRLVNGDAYKATDWSKSGVPIIRIQNLNDPNKPFNYWSGATDGLVQVRRGEVLLAWSGTPGTSFGAHIWNGEDGVLNQHIFRVDITSKEITPEWFVRAVNFRLQVLIGQAHGAVGLAHVTKSEVNALEIPLPPLTEQERIAARLTEQLAAVERARAAAQARLAAAEALPAAYLREVFEGLERAVPARRLEEMSDIASGITLGKRPHALNGREVPYLRVANVQDGHLLLDDVYTIRATEEEITELTLHRGDLVLTEGGDRDKLGRGTWWNGELPECIHQNHIFRVRLHSGIIEHEFFGLQVRSAYAKNYFLAHAKQTTGIATINRQVLAGLPVLLPDPAEQRRIAADLSRRLADADRLTASLRDELAAIEALPAALLREAFGAGQPQGE